MLRVRIQTIPTQSKSPAGPRNSLLRTVWPSAVNAHEFPARADPSPFRFRPKSRLWNRSRQRGRQFQKRAAFPENVQSSRQTVLPWLTDCVAQNFLFRVRSASADSLLAAVARRVQTLSPNNPQRRRAALLLRFSPYPARRQSAPAHRSLRRARSSRRKSHPALASRRRAKRGQASPFAEPREPPPPIPLPRCDSAIQARGANRNALPAHRPRSELSS